MSLAGSAALEAFSRVHADMGITTARVFLSAGNAPGSTVTEIADALRIPVPRASSEVSSLCGMNESSVLARMLSRKGIDGALLRYGDDPTNRRRKPIWLTSRGEDLIASVESALAWRRPTQGLLDGIDACVEGNTARFSTLNAAGRSLKYEMELILEAFGAYLKSLDITMAPDATKGCLEIRAYRKGDLDKRCIFDLKVVVGADGCVVDWSWNSYNGYLARKFTIGDPYWSKFKERVDWVGGDPLLGLHASFKEQMGVLHLAFLGEK